MSKSDDVFASVIGMPEAVDPDNSNKGLTTAFPSSSVTAAAKAKKPKYECKYARFVLDDGGHPELEHIMNMSASGQWIVQDERWNFTKQGDTIVVVKYWIPVDDMLQIADEAASILGRRRQRKALERSKEEDT